MNKIHRGHRISLTRNSVPRNWAAPSLAAACLLVMLPAAARPTPPEPIIINKDLRANGITTTTSQPDGELQTYTWPSIGISKWVSGGRTIQFNLTLPEGQVLQSSEKQAAKESLNVTLSGSWYGAEPPKAPNNNVVVKYWLTGLKPPISKDVPNDGNPRTFLAVVSELGSLEFADMYEMTSDPLRFRDIHIEITTGNTWPHWYVEDLKCGFSRQQIGGIVPEPSAVGLAAGVVMVGFGLARHFRTGRRPKE